MKPVSEFSFLCKDGLHHYSYNPNSKISTFTLFHDGVVVHQEYCYCHHEEYHTRRVQYDFNYNCLDLPKGYNYIVRQKVLDICLTFMQSFLFVVFGGLYYSMMVVVTILEVFDASKKRKSGSTKSSRKSNITIPD